MALKRGVWKICQYLTIILAIIIIFNQLFLLKKGEIIIEYNNNTYLNKNDDIISRSKMHENNDDDNNNELKLTLEMINSETNEKIICDPNKYNYIKLLLNDLKKYNLRSDKNMVTSSKIDKLFEEKDKIRWWWLRRARLQIINGNLYTNNIEIGSKDEEGYRTGMILYLKRIFKLYGKYIPNTDLLWHYHDKKGHMMDLSGYDWKNTSIVPIFVSDFNEASLPNTRTLYFIPRGYLKYKYFADIAESEGGENISKLYCAKNIRRIKDYLEYLEIKKNKPNLLKWENKKINKAVFRGYLENGFSRKHFFNTINLPDIIDISKEYFDAKFTTEWANTADNHRSKKYKSNDKFHANKEKEFKNLQSNSLNVEQQFEFKYQINIDGYGVRDNLIYQMLSGSIILKQLSTLIEFWYFDLIDNKHIIFWENILDLINIVIRLVDSLQPKHRKNSQSLTGYHQWILKNWIFMINNNMTKYNNHKLKQITENAKQFVDDYLGQNNMDCFFVHMIEIYNYYFFDIKSLPSFPHSRLNHIRD